jgi:hypothetical protein
MVFIYQFVTKALTSQILPEECCPACEKTGNVEITLYQKYVSAFWVPTFGMGQRTGACCTSCGYIIKDPDASVLAKKKLSDALEESLRLLKSGYHLTFRQRIYPWSLLIAFAVFFTVLIGGGLINKSISSGTKNSIEAETRQYVMQPNVGDIYKVKWLASGISTGTLVKVLRIDGDRMVIVRNKANIEGQNTFNKKYWDGLSRDDGAFDAQEYDVSLSRLQGTSGSGEYGEFCGDRIVYATLLPTYLKIEHVVERTEK